MLLGECDFKASRLVNPIEMIINCGIMTSATFQDVSEKLESQPGTVDCYSESLMYRRVKTQRLLSFYIPTGPIEKVVQAESDPIVIEQPDYEMAQLEKAAEIGDIRGFVLALEQMDWQKRKADDYVKCVKLSLSVGAHLAARRFAMEGSEHFPEDPVLAKMAHILAPPKTRIVKGPPDPSLSANRDWFSEHGHEYRGQWVAVKNGILLGHSTDPEDIKKIPDWEKATITRIVK